MPPDEMDTIDRAATLLGTGLMFLGIVVLGLWGVYTMATPATDADGTATTDAATN